MRDVWTTKTVTCKTLRGDAAGPCRSTSRDPLVGNCPRSDKSSTAADLRARASRLRPHAGYAFTGRGWTAVVNELISEATSPSRWSTISATRNDPRRACSSPRTSRCRRSATTCSSPAPTATPTDFNLQGFFAGATGIAASIAGLAPRRDGGQRGVVGGLGVDLDAAVGLPDGELELPDNLRRPDSTRSPRRKTRWRTHGPLSSARCSGIRACSAGRPAALARDVDARHRRDAQREPPGLRPGDLQGACADDVSRATHHQLRQPR